MMPFKPSDAIEMQDALSRYWAGGEGARFMRGWTNARAATGASTHGVSPDHRRLMEHTIMVTGTTYWVQRDMVALIEHAARSMPEQTLLATDLPARRGFALLESPVLIADVHGKVCNVSAYSWAVLPNTDAPDGGVLISIYSDTHDERDQYHKGNGAVGYPVRLVLLSENAFRFGEHITDQSFDSSESGGIDNINVGEGLTMNCAGMGADTMRAFVAMPKTLWTLLGQRLTQADHVAPERAARRRLEKAGSPLADKRIVTVKLRLAAPHAADGDQDAEHARRDWTHRWIVSGHWRNQWHPSIRQHRVQWISPYTKGPDDKPLVLRRKVYKLER